MLRSLLILAMIVAAFTVRAPAAFSVGISVAPVASPQVASAATPVAGGDYRVGAGDLLRISVFDHPELQGDLRVSESGQVTFPLLGQVAVAGMSTHEVESSLTRGLAGGGFIREPQVSVLVIDFQSQKISVLGQVAKPGQYSLTASLRALELLAQAGGVVNIVAADDAVLIRKNGSKESIDLVRMFNGDPTQNPLVSGGDTLYIPRAPQFYVYGQVQHPGVYRLERNMTVSQAISAGGGLTPKGSERWLLVKRRDAAGKERKVSVKSSDYLRPDDVLMVKEALF